VLLFLHRVGEKRLEHLLYLVISPTRFTFHSVATRLLLRLLLRLLPLAPPPFRNTVLQGLHRLHRFLPGKSFFLYFPPSILSFPHFFHFYGGKYAIYAIYATALCFEPKFDRRVKTEVCKKVCKRALDLCKQIPPQCVQSAVKASANGAVA
jgi:hypothetical protein